MIKKLTTSILALALFGAAVSAQFGPRRDPGAPFDLMTDSWNARWISVPETGPQDYGVYYFRKDVELAAIPVSYKVHVTGDNRYKLYVNEILVSLGPAKGDATHWNYETVDLVPYLKAGKNVIAAVVWHEGPQKPDSQVSVAAGFLLQGEGEARGLYTDGSWKCLRDEAYSPLRPIVSGYYAAGPGEQVDMARTIKDWKSPDADLSAWSEVRPGPAGVPVNHNSSNMADGHNLRPSTLPQMELSEEAPLQVRRDGGLKIADGIGNITVPAHTSTEILLDQGRLTNGYMNVSLSGGKGGSLAIGYAESLYIPAATQEAIPDNVPEQYRPFLMTRNEGKGNRNEIDGKIFFGREDVLLTDGSPLQEFTTLDWRTWRYVRLKVETANEPMIIHSVRGTFTGYPFELAARLDTDDATLSKMLEIGWRTARLCAVETYMDCPYYEQLQYLGDTRIQALVTLFNTRDDRLVKNFLHLADISRNADGITKSRYPTTITQYIQPYALSYIYALHDYMKYGADTGFVWDLLPGAEQIIHYFSHYQQEDGRIRNLPGWNFSDWVYTPSWNYGSPLKGADGCSILMDLQLLYALEMMADMESEYGNTWQAAHYADEAERLASAIQEAYWSPERGLFADRSEKDIFSQHANTLAIICGLFDDARAREIGLKILSDETLSPASVYYKYYLHEALVKAGLGDSYLDWLDVWRENIDMGLTTWGETSDVNGTRSDCHAWGASPNIEFFRTVLGIDSDAVAFKKVRIEPHLGTIRKIGGSMPHPDGDVSVNYERQGDRLKAEITLPEGITGRFVWNGKEYPLTQGTNKINIK